MITRVLFVCHGNICRSPMAEFVFKDMVAKSGLAEDVYVASAATSTEEIGNGMHSGTIKILKKYDIPYENRKAVQLKKSDYEKYDYIVGMDSANIANIKRIVGDDKQKKVFKLLEFAGISDDIADPWYTGKFDITYDDICEGCEALLVEIMSRVE